MTDKTKVMFTTELVSDENLKHDFWDMHAGFCDQGNDVLGITERGHNGSYGCYFTNGETYYDLKNNDKLRKYYDKVKELDNKTIVFFQDKDVTFDVTFLLD